MKAKPRSAAPITVHALLTTLALVAAYFTWTRDRAQVQSEWVVALDINKRDIGSLVYEDEKRTVTLERRTNSDGDAYAWVKVLSRSKLPVRPPAAPPAAAMPAAPGPVAAPDGAKPAGTFPTPAAAKPGAPAAIPTGSKPAAQTAAPHPGQAPTKGGDKAVDDKNKAPSPPAPANSAVAAAPGAKVASPASATASAPVSAPAGASAAASSSAAPSAPAADEVKETITIKEFRGNEQADKLVELFAPMRVVRALGVVDDKKAKEFGLDSSKKSLTIVAKEQATKFVLGSNSYGSGDVYARDAQGQVYLLGHKMLSDFEFAEVRLMERRLHRFERADVDRIEVQVTTATGPKSRVLLQRNRQDPVNFFFTDGASPDKRDDTLRNWADKMLRMSINDYVNKGDEPQATAPASGSPAPGDIVTMRFFEGKRKLGEAVFSRYPGKTGQNEYYARTETTIGLVRLLTSTAENAIQDAEKW